MSESNLGIQRRTAHLRIVQACLRPDADVGEGMKKAKDVQQPQNHGNNHNCIQDGLDRSLHWYQVDQPEQDTDYDQSDQ
jgi:hypothetical protein